MKFKIMFLIGIVMAIAGFGGLVFSQWRMDHGNDRAKAQAAKFHDYCQAVAIALERDAKDLETGLTKNQEAAAGRFGEQVTFHSEYEIQLCAARHVNLEQRPMCAIGPNLPCLAKLAHEAAAAVREGL